MRKEVQPVLIVLSILALLNVMFVPIFDVWGGLTPSDVDTTFFEVIEAVFEDEDCWRHWVVIFTMSIFIPSLFMFIAALCGGRGFFITSNVIGIIIWFKQIIDYGMEDDGFSDMFDFDDCSISIGTWIAIGIFVISFFVALSSKKKAETNSGAGYVPAVPNVVPSANPVDSSSVVASALKSCPNCGAEYSENIKFCGKCGYNFESVKTQVNKSGTMYATFCSNCGEKQNEPRSPFCQNCGSVLPGALLLKDESQNKLEFLLKDDGANRLNIMIVHHPRQTASNNPNTVYRGEEKTQLVYAGPALSTIIENLKDEITNDEFPFSFQNLYSDQSINIGMPIVASWKASHLSRPDFDVTIGRVFSFQMPLCDAVESWDFIIYRDIFQENLEISQIQSAYFFLDILKNAYERKQIIYKATGNKVQLLLNKTMAIPDDYKQLDDIRKLKAQDYEIIEYRMGEEYQDKFRSWVERERCRFHLCFEKGDTSGCTLKHILQLYDKAQLCPNCGSVFEPGQLFCCNCGPAKRPTFNNEEV